jgi:hypothetical protein
MADGGTRTSLQVPLTVTYRPEPLAAVRDVAVTEELEPIGYLRIFRRANGQLLHVAEWNVVNVDGAVQ